MSEALLSSTSPGRLRGLVHALEASVAHSILLEAPEASDRLDAIEAYLRDNWDSLIAEQGRRRPNFGASDLVWDRVRPVLVDRSAGEPRLRNSSDRADRYVRVLSAGAAAGSGATHQHVAPLS